MSLPAPTRPDQGRTPGGDVIAVIRRQPRPPMIGDDRFDRRVSRALSHLRGTTRSAR